MTSERDDERVVETRSVRDTQPPVDRAVDDRTDRVRWDERTVERGRWDAGTRVGIVPMRDRVRWGPIVAGLVTTLTTLLLLSMLGVGLGLTALDSSGNQDTNAIGVGGAIISAIIALVAFFIGGYVAGRTSAVIGRGGGALNGFLVWALGVTLILVLGTIGLSGLLGAAGDIMGNIQAPDINQNQATDAVRNSALISFVSLALPAIASTLGGWLGARTDVEEVVAD